MDAVPAIYANVVRCAIYTRQSVHRPGGDPAVSSCALQRESCLDFVAEQSRHGWHALGEQFDDEGESGGSTDRPALARLLAAVDAGQVDRVVVYRFDRLTRSVRDWTRLLDRFRQHGVGFSVVAGDLMVGGGALQQLQLNVLAIFAEWERDMIGERLSHARAARTAHGYRSSGEPPFGYKSDERTKQLVIVENEAAIVRWFFTCARDGMKTSALAAKANTLHFKTKRGKDWMPKAVLQLLTRPTYAARNKDGGPMVHTAIVPPALFDEVQALINERRTREPTKRIVEDPDEKTAIELFDPFILRGLITCGKCGKPMTTSSSETITLKIIKRLRRNPDAVARYYRCRTVGCAGQVPASEAEHTARAALHEPPAHWSDEDKAQLAVHATAFDMMWPVNQRRVFATNFAKVEWDRKLDGFRITFVPNSALVEEEASLSCRP